LLGARAGDDGEEADEQHASNLAADLYQEELDEGLSDDLGLRPAALSAQNGVWRPGPTVSRLRVASRS
jgi:hypothetical protein